MAHRKRWPRGTWMRLRSPDTLRALMKQSDISFGQLADYVGCSKGFISHLLAGRRKSCLPEKAERIAGVLHVPVEVLFEVKQSISGTSVDTQKVTAA